MTDPKGDRSKRPSDQSDPDLFTHVTEKRSDGIVIRGAKAHMTGGVNSHEILIMPTQNMTKGDEAYAVCAAIPLKSPGITLIFGRQSNEERKFETGIDAGNKDYGVVGGEALIVFEDVFVPWERVFMCGEIDFTGLLVERFATMHRQNYGGCKGGVSDVIVGATALAAQCQGTSGASHVKDKITEMMHLAESVYSGSVACAAMGSRTPSGAYILILFWPTVRSTTSRVTFTRFPAWRMMWPGASWQPCLLTGTCGVRRSASMWRNTWPA